MDYTNIVPWGVSIISLIFVILTFSRNSAKEKKKEVKEDDATLNSIKEGLLKANMKLDQVCATTNETRSDIKALNNDVTLLDRRVTVIEHDVNIAYSLIDELKAKGE